MNQTLALNNSSEDTSNVDESNMEPVLEEMKIDDVEIDKVCILESKIYLIMCKLFRSDNIHTLCLNLYLKFSECTTK